MLDLYFLSCKRTTPCLWNGSVLSLSRGTLLIYRTSSHIVIVFYPCTFSLYKLLNWQNTTKKNIKNKNKIISKQKHFSPFGPLGKRLCSSGVGPCHCYLLHLLAFLFLPFHVDVFSLFVHTILNLFLSCWFVGSDLSELFISVAFNRSLSRSYAFNTNTHPRIQRQTHTLHIHTHIKIKIQIHMHIKIHIMPIHIIF